jgi:hypothetical protein
VHPISISDPEGNCLKNSHEDSCWKHGAFAFEECAASTGVYLFIVYLGDKWVTKNV